MKKARKEQIIMEAPKKYSKKAKIVKTEIKQPKQVELFHIVKTDKNKFAIVCANKIVSQKYFATERQAIEYIKSKPYELIINTAVLALLTLKTNEQNENKDKKEN